VGDPLFIALHEPGRLPRPERVMDEFIDGSVSRLAQDRVEYHSGRCPRFSCRVRLWASPQAWLRLRVGLVTDPRWGPIAKRLELSPGVVATTVMALLGVKSHQKPGRRAGGWIWSLPVQETSEA